MANKDKLKELMSQRSPIRKAVTPVNIYEDSSSDTAKKRTVQPNAKANERTHNRTVQPNDIANGVPNGFEEKGILAELKGGSEEERKTERYSFEIYSDQKVKLEEFQYKYKKKTGKKISASRVLREALDIHLEKLNA
jgi:hypothetical protein